MQNLKADTVRFLTREGSNDLDRRAAKRLAKCDVEVRHAGADGEAGGGVDVLIHGTPDDVGEIKSGNDAGRVENAVREACEHRVRMLQWVETTKTTSTGTGAGAGDGRGAHEGIERANSGKPPQHHRDSQGHGSSQSPKQPGDTQINPPPNPRR